MKPVYLLQLAVVALVFGTAYVPQASVLQAMSLAELTTSADNIVVGNVRGVHSAWDARMRTIVSTVDVDVDEVWKGQASASLTVVALGGAVGDVEMTVEGMPRFVVGEESLFFLHGKSRLQVVGMSQGKRSLAWDAASSQWLVQPPPSEGVVEVGAGGKLRAARRQMVISLPELREQVTKLIGSMR